MGLALDEHTPRVAAAYAIGYKLFLRTGEILGRSAKDFTFAEDLSTLQVDLGFTKGGKRRGVREAVTTTDADTILLAALVMLGRPPGEGLLVEGEAYFRASFRRHIVKLGLDPDRYKPYSLRRGGATAAFLQSGSHDTVMQIGRLVSSRTARIYIDGSRVALYQIRHSRI